MIEWLLGLWDELWTGDEPADRSLGWADPGG